MSVRHALVVAAVAALGLAGCGGGRAGRGDVVTFEPTDAQVSRCGATDLSTARVIGVAGDRVELRTGSVYLNDEALDEDYVTTSAADSAAAVTVPEGQLYVLGDDRARACDSRVSRFLPRANLRG